MRKPRTFIERLSQYIDLTILVIGSTVIVLLLMFK